MSFCSLNFLAFLLIISLLYHIMPCKFKNHFLLLASYGFYGLYSWKVLPFLFFFTLFIYFFGLLVYQWNQKLVLFAVVILVLMPLLVCKYFNFGIIWLERFLHLLQLSFQFSHVSIVLPLGISYFSFKSLGYLIDVYQHKTEPEKNFFALALFVTFFPEMLVGPIDRTSNLLKQINQDLPKDLWNNIEKGVILLLGGYFEKLVVADRLAIIVDTVYGNLYSYEGFYVVLAVFCYSLQIYFDFAGCTCMALGCGKILGYSLPENFRQPYLAVSVEDFWRRWHISLTSWLRDYIYIPLGGNRKGVFRKYVNVMIVFLVSGLWHGAGMNFVIWGGMNGVFQIAGIRLKSIKSKLYQWMHIQETSEVCIWWKRVWVFVWMTCAWIFFRANNLSQAFFVFRKIFSAWNPWVLFDGSIYELGISQKSCYLLISLLVIMLIVSLLHERNVSISAWYGKQSYVVKCVVTYILIFAIIIFGIYGSAYNASDFIYMQF